jgi:hypothetical protein
MPLALIIVGLVLVSTGVQGTQGQLAALIVSDFTGAGNFFYFIVGIATVGALGYYSPLQNSSRLIILLLVIVLILSNRGFFAALQSAVSGASANKTPAPALPVPTVAPGGPAMNTPSVSGTLQNTIPGVIPNIPGMLPGF